MKYYRIFIILLCLTSSTSSADEVKVAPPIPPAPADAAFKPEELAIEQRPYRIRVFTSADTTSGLDANRLDQLLQEWLILVHRFVGAPWEVEMSREISPLLASADPANVGLNAFEQEWPNVDKVWLIKIRGADSTLVFEGREYDVATRRLGPFQRSTVPVLRDAPRLFFRFSLDLFAPYATVGEHFGKDVALTVQGGALEPATEIGRVVSKGTVFQPLRVVQKKDGSTLLQDIALTYLRVENVNGPRAACSLVSSFRDPFTKRVVQKNWLVALGVKPGKSQTRLRFTTLPDKAPAAGYVLTARRFPDGNVRDLGTTDRQGRIVLDPSQTDGLTIFRLVAGSAEPMREFPLMPGDNDAERALPAFDPLPLTIALETQLDSLRDTVIDLIAIRARLEARLKSRYDGENIPEAEEALKEFQALPSKEKYAEKLATLKTGAALEQSKSKSPIMTKTVQAQFAELESLIARYLDDEGFKAYADAISKLKVDAKDPKKKAEAKPSTAAVPPKKLPEVEEPKAKSDGPAKKTSERPPGSPPF